jgi:hypothetical protein
LGEEVSVAVGQATGTGEGVVAKRLVDGSKEAGLVLALTRTGRRRLSRAKGQQGQEHPVEQDVCKEDACSGVVGVDGGSNFGQCQRVTRWTTSECD